MSTKDQLLQEIDRFLAISGVSVTKFGQDAAGERQILKRLRRGGDLTTDKADRIRAYIANWRPTRPKMRVPARAAA